MSVYHLNTAELLRLNAAYAAIRRPEQRAEFLILLENWAREQWFAQDLREAE